MNAGSPSPQMLNVAAVAQHLRVSTKTVRRLITAGELPAHRIGRSLRISADDLHLFLKRRRG